MSGIIENEIVVIGGGPGGYAAAFHAAEKGKQVTLINDQPKPGGACLHVGCIPSKALLHTAKLITDTRQAADFGVHFAPPEIKIDEVRSHWQQVVTKLGNGLEYLCKKREVEFVQARATLLDGETLELSDGSTRKFQHCILATGSSPIIPKRLQIDSDRLMTSTEALQLQGIPCSLLVVGGGYIGLELGYVYAALGCKVTVVEKMDGLLPGVDRDLVRPLHERLNSLFQNIHLKTEVTQLTTLPDGIEATLSGEAIGERSEKFDRVLIAVGRCPNSQGLGLENTTIELDGVGFVVTNDQRRTSEENIFAIGDVAGQPLLAHKATHEGKIVAEIIAGEGSTLKDRPIPAVVFTDPEIAWVGLTEEEASRKAMKVETVRYGWGASGRAQTLGRDEGLTKLLIDPETEKILGAGIVGCEAGELIAEATLAIEMGATARDLSLTIHAHPTLSETIMEAGEAYFGAATHFIPTKKRVGRG